jgi:hypothetical protein
MFKSESFWMKLAFQRKIEFSYEPVNIDFFTTEKSLVVHEVKHSHAFGSCPHTFEKGHSFYLDEAEVFKPIFSEGLILELIKSAHYNRKGLFGRDLIPKTKGESFNLPMRNLN